MQNPVCGKQFAWASVGFPGGARAANMLTRTNADKTTTRLIALLTPLRAGVRSPRQRHRRAIANIVPALGSEGTVTSSIGVAYPCADRVPDAGRDRRRCVVVCS